MILILHQKNISIVRAILSNIFARLQPLTLSYIYLVTRQHEQPSSGHFFLFQCIFCGVFLVRSLPAMSQKNVIPLDLLETPRQDLGGCPVCIVWAEWGKTIQQGSFFVDFCGVYYYLLFLLSPFNYSLSGNYIDLQSFHFINENIVFIVSYLSVLSCFFFVPLCVLPYFGFH